MNPPFYGAIGRDLTGLALQPAPSKGTTINSAKIMTNPRILEEWKEWLDWKNNSNMIKFHMPYYLSSNNTRLKAQVSIRIDAPQEATSLSSMLGQHFVG